MASYSCAASRIVLVQREAARFRHVVADLSFLNAERFYSVLAAMIIL